MTVTFLETVEQTTAAIASDQHQLLILDCDNGEARAATATLEAIGRQPRPIPVVLLSLRHDKTPMLRLLEGYDFSHLVAKHGAIRVAKGTSRVETAMLDERELRVTVEKVVSRDIFGIDKYIGSWGVAFEKRIIKSIAEKGPFLDEFEAYVRDLECPNVVVPEIVTVAEEFLLNAMIHAPRNPDGSLKYEDQGIRPDLVLAPNEYVQVVYGCDGQRLMVSVSDNFGGLNKKTLFEYLKRGFTAGIEPEQKPSGAGLGLSLSLRNIHQLVFNVHDRRRTEAIAGWYLRVQSAQEFRSVGKSLNVFWLDENYEPEERAMVDTIRFTGRIDEAFDFGRAAGANIVDMRDVTTITSRGLIRWIDFVRSKKDKGLELIALPDVLLFQAANVSGVIEGATVTSVLVSFECDSCTFEERRELAPDEVLTVDPGRCPECNAPIRFAGLVPEYTAFLDALHRYAR